MKVFVAAISPKEKISNTDFHWCENGEILMFSMNQHLVERSMVGHSTRLGTTRITVKDLNISKDFYKEILTESVEESFKTKVEPNGEFIVGVGAVAMFNINHIVDELLDKAACFEDGENIQVIGRKVYSLELV